MKADDQLNDEYETPTNYWPIVIWQPTFRKIICYFVLMWSILSLINFFINEESLRLTGNNINNYSILNFALSLFNFVIGLTFYK